MVHIPSLSSLSLPTSIFCKKKENKITNQTTRTKTKLGLSLVLGPFRRPWVRALSPHKCRVLQVLARASILSGCVAPFLLRVLNACWRHFAPSGTAQGCNELEVCVAGEVCPFPSSESCRKKLSSLCAGHCPCQGWQAHWVFKGSLVDKLLTHPALLSVPWWNISAVWGTGEACLLSSSSGPWGLEFSPPNLGRWRRWFWPAPLLSCLRSSWRASAGTPGLCFQRC